MILVSSAIIITALFVLYQLPVFLIAIGFLHNCQEKCLLTTVQHKTEKAWSCFMERGKINPYVIIFRLLVTYDGCKLALSGSGNQPKGSFTGHAFLTSHRVMFLAKDSSKTLKSFSMPFVYMKGVAIKQPTFGPNHIEGFVKPESNHWMV